MHIRKRLLHDLLQKRGGRLLKRFPFDISRGLQYDEVSMQYETHIDPDILSLLPGGKLNLARFVVIGCPTAVRKPAYLLAAASGGLNNFTFAKLY